MGKSGINRTIVALAGLALIAACGHKDPNALTADENRQLDNAAEMLDASPDSLTANEDMTLGNGEDSGTETGDAADGNSGNAQ